MAQKTSRGSKPNRGSKAKRQAQSLVTRHHSLQRGLVIATLIGSTVAMTPAGLDAFSVLKAAIVVVGAAACVGVAVSLVFINKPVAMPSPGPLVATVGLFVLGLLIATITAPSVWTAVVGVPGRNTGLAVYLSAVVLFVVVLRAFPQRVEALAWATLAASGIVMVYGLMQQAQIDPVNWDFSSLGTRVVGTLGNPNFAAAYLGIGVPLAVWAALTRRSTAVRAAWLAGAVALFGTALLTESFQGPLIAVAGAFVVVVAAVLNWDHPRRRALLGGLWGLAVVGSVVLVAGFARIGPLSALADKATVQIRLWYWEAALGIFGDHPWAGVGLDHYASFYRAYRPEGTATIATTISADSPHNVVLAMLANGGLLLGLGYLAVLIVVAWFLVRGLGRTSGAQRLLLGGVGGAWVAYVLQALISIEMPSLVMTGWVLAAAVVLASGEEIGWRSWPGGASTRRSVAPVGAALGVAVVVLSLVAVSWPVRANRVAGEGRDLLAVGDAEGSLAAFTRAYELAPRELTYLSEIGLAQANSGQVEQAYETFGEILERNPRDFQAAMNRARLATRLGRVDEAREAYELALGLDPVATLVKDEYAALLLDADDPEPAVELLEASVRIDPAGRQGWELLAEAYAAIGRDADAAEARARAEALPAPPPSGSSA